MKKSSLVLVSLLSFYVLISFVIPVSSSPDPAHGFLTWRSMARGAPFNHYALPDPQDPSIDKLTFQSWWSPGQYLIPGALSLTGLSLGKSVWLVVAIFSTVGIIGCFCLYKELGFSSELSAVTCLTIALSGSFSIPFHTYTGGEVLSFGLLPWAILFTLRLKSLPVFSLPLFIVIFLFGAFLKLTFVITGLALLAFAFWVKVTETKEPKLLLPIAAKSSIIFLGFYSVLYWFHLSKGSTPGSPTGPKLSFFAIMYAVSAPFSGLVTFSMTISHAFLRPGSPFTGGIASFWWIFLPFACLAILVYWEAFKLGPPLYRSLALAFLAVYIVTLSALYLSGADISFEDRHFRPATIVIAPGVVLLAWQSQLLWLRIVLKGMFTACLAFTLASFAIGVRNNYRAPVGKSGFAFPSTSRSELNLLHRKDEEARDGDIITVPSVVLGIEIQRARITLEK